jgi:hypothetical protein
MVQQAAVMPKSWTFSEAAVPVSTSKILAMAAAATATPLAMKKPVLCQGKLNRSALSFPLLLIGRLLPQLMRAQSKNLLILPLRSDRRIERYPSHYFTPVNSRLEDF